MNARDGHTMTDTELDKKLDQSTAPRITPAHLESLIKKCQFHQWPGTMLITCVLTLENGFTVSGESACASPENFKEDVGRAIARRNAVDKIWALAGYTLRDKLALLEATASPSGRILDIGEVITHIGTKVIHATPMTRAAYNSMRGWQVPDDEDGNDDGFLVQYTDGGVPNVPGFTGYVSWSPQDVFERAYGEVGVTLKKTTFLDRMVTELEELTDRADKCAQFILTDAFDKLSEKERVALRAQHHAMTEYQWHLAGRVQRLARQPE